jgi:hypothetical protein
MLVYALHPTTTSTTSNPAQRHHHHHQGMNPIHTRSLRSRFPTDTRVVPQIPCSAALYSAKPADFPPSTCPDFLALSQECPMLLEKSCK